MPFTSIRNPTFPVDTPADVAALVDLLGPAATDQRLRDALCDLFAYVAGVHLDWFRPHQERVILELLDGFQVTFDTRCALLHGAPDTCVEHLARRVRDRWSEAHLESLAAIGTAPALAAVADLVRGHGGKHELEDVGFRVPPAGPAQQRFSSHLLAVERRPVADLAELLAVDHPVGLPLDRVLREPAATPAEWHFMSLRAAALPGVPAWPAERMHLLGAGGWEVAGTVGEDGRWYDVTIEDGAPVDDEPWTGNDDPDSWGAVVLRPYDDTLVYSNSHIHSTPNVFGTVGGPPIGVYSNPSCRSCGLLMFHVATVTNHIRDYGDGFCSLYICEDCHVTACTAPHWN